MPDFESTDELLKAISQLEPLARQLEPDRHQRSAWLMDLQQNTDAFIGRLDQGKAYHRFNDLESILHLHPETDPCLSLAQVLDDLKKGMLQKGLNPASGGHLGYIPGGGIYGGVLGDYLAALYNQYAGIYYGGPGAVKIENEILRWLNRWMGYPDGSLGNLTSGGSMANLIAIVTAREAFEIKSKEIAQCCIYLTQQAHHCIHKAIRIAGLGEAQLRTIPTDHRFKMNPGALHSQIESDCSMGLKPFLLVGSAGTTDTGAIDPLEALGEICQKYRIWFHVDAAYGGFFNKSQLKNPDQTTVQDSFKGISLSDSMAIDPHKGLFLSYGLGAVLIKDVKAMYQAHYYRAAYMQDTLHAQEELSPADLSPELTKHFRGLRLWIPLKLYGIKPFLANLDEKILLCRYFYWEVQKLGFETGPYPETSVCIYRYVPSAGDANAFNQAIIDKVLDDGRVFISSTTLDGTFWIRLAVLSFRTHLQTIKICLTLLENAVKSLKT